MWLANYDANSQQPPSDQKELPANADAPTCARILRDLAQSLGIPTSLNGAVVRIYTKMDCYNIYPCNIISVLDSSHVATVYSKRPSPIVRRGMFSQAAQPSPPVSKSAENLLVVSFVVGILVGALLRK